MSMTKLQFVLQLQILTESEKASQKMFEFAMAKMIASVFGMASPSVLDSQKKSTTNSETTPH